MKIGAQLYTVRDFTKTKENLYDTLKKISEIGYSCLQISAIGTEITVDEVVEICNELNLEIVITHTSLDRIINETDVVIKEHKLMGAKYIGLGALTWGTGNEKQGYVNFVEQIADAVERIAQAGLKFMYHNHDFEFLKFDQKTGFDFLIEQLPLAGFTLDTFWVQAGGGDPAEWMRKLKNRIPVIHLKDMVMENGERRMAEVLEGNLNWNSIFDAARDAHVEYAMVEQDDCYGKNPFECLRLSYENLKKLGYQ